MIEEIESGIAVAFWYLSPFVSIGILLLIGAGIGLVIDRYFASKVEKEYQDEINRYEEVLQGRFQYIEELEAKLAKFRNHARGARGRFTR